MGIADKLTTIAENIPKVYQAGYEKGVAEGGGDSWYDTFWDNFQQNGERNVYSYAFYGGGWNDEIFKPKYKFINANVYSFERMFSNASGGITKITPELFDYDRMKSYYGSYMFYAADIKSIELSMKRNSSIAHMFRDCKAETIILHDWSGHAYDRTFESCSKLKHLRIEGTIGGSRTFNLSSSPLDAESIRHIIGNLSDTTNGIAISFLTSAVNNAFETAEGLADGSTSAEWLALVATKPNWTISLA